MSYKLINISILILIFTAGVSVASEIAISPEVTKKVDSLFIIASSAEVKYKDMVQPAIDSIAAIGEMAVTTAGGKVRYSGCPRATHYK